MQIQLSDHFTYRKLYGFVLPSIAMMIFTSVYSVVDGFFVSNYTCKTDFAALNIIFPLLMIVGGIGFMTGTGGSALVAKTLGEGNREKANEYFSLVTYMTIAIGVLTSALGIIFLKPIARLLGAEGQMLESCVLYGTIMMAAMPAFMLQNSFQAFFVAAEKPRMGLYMMLIAGCTNMAGDALFVGVFGWGLAGAAAASAAGEVLSAVIPVFYFSGKNGSLLKLGKTRIMWRAVLKTCTNGSSELLGSISASLVGMLYNVRLLSIAGEDGVAAYGVMMYVSFVFAAVFIGYSVGCAPIVSYNFGGKNREELKNLFKKSMISVSICGFAMAGLAIASSGILSRLFVSYDESLCEMTRHGFILFSVHFIFCGVNIFGSSFFTALNDGLTSALISFMRTMVFQVSAVLVLPVIITPMLDGIWLSTVFAEFLSLLLTGLLLFVKRKKYGYF